MSKIQSEEEFFDKALLSSKIDKMSDINLQKEVDTAKELSEKLFKPLNPVTVWFRELKRSLYNLYYFFPVIWRSRDWDYSYIYDLLAVKLRKMHEYRLKDSSYMPHVGDYNINKRMLECAILAERLSHKRGFSFAEYYYKKVGKASEDCGGETDEWIPLCGGKAYEFKQKKGSDKYWKALRLWGNKSRAQEQEAKARLFYLLEKYIERMWD